MLELYFQVRYDYIFLTIFLFFNKESDRKDTLIKIKSFCPKENLNLDMPKVCPRGS